MGNEQSCQRFRQGAKMAACNTMNRVEQRDSAPCPIISRYRDSFGVSDRADTGACVRSQEFTVDIYYNCSFHFSFCKTSMELWNPLQKKGLGGQGQTTGSRGGGDWGEGEQEGGGGGGCRWQLTPELARDGCRCQPRRCARRCRWRCHR